MCRLLVYKGKQPIQLSHLLTRPAHSIINQAFDSRLRLDTTRGPINGDGFGVGWYDFEETPNCPNDLSPCIFTSVTPAWNNQNLARLAEKIKSPMVFAHVRASTSGMLSETNCHPWQYGRLMWMHNGSIGEFSKIKRRLQQSLKDEFFLLPQGNTDSEWAFALFLNQLKDAKNGPFTHDVLRQAMLDTIAQLNKWAKDAGVMEPSLLNFAVTDGRSAVCTRYINSTTEEAASLYFSSGTTFFEYEEGGHYRMIKSDKREDIVLVASEPLTFEKADWIPIETNSMIIITPKNNVLIYPIVDEYETHTDPTAKRSGSFAESKGLRAAPRNALQSNTSASHGKETVASTLSAPIPVHT